jgi:hypothetical protein
MSEAVAAVAALTSAQSKSAVDAAEAVNRHAELAQFQQTLQHTEQSSAAQYIRQPAAPEAGLPEALLNYVGQFDAKFSKTLDHGIGDIAALDFSDPMSIVHVMQLQADMFSVTMELELATKLADSGRHFTTTLFNNQG